MRVVETSCRDLWVWRVVAVTVGLMACSFGAHAQARYTINGAEVTDANTSLVWQHCSGGQNWDAAKSTCQGTVERMTWPQALAYAKAQAASSGVAWRLPNVKELVSLVSERRTQPAIAAQSFPRTLSDGYWSSTPYANNLNTSWVVYFSDGRTHFEARELTFAVRLVRDAP